MMTIISAKGETEFGVLNVRISGEKMVAEIECDPGMESYIRTAIDRADGWIANGYHPEGGTMLQAYAYLTMLFGYDSVTVDGKLEEIPGGEDGVLY